jgi:inhibitor of KinA
MAEAILQLHVCDDWISCALPDAETSLMASASLRHYPQWLEIVAGLDSLAVQFDPTHLDPEEAAILFRQQLTDVGKHALDTFEKIEIPVCYDDLFSPDLNWVSERLDIPTADLPAWHSGLQFNVTMLGFMPGFAYLSCQDKIAEIGRLDRPRSKVAAGSIGITGRQSCLYSFESPGGWPIVGRTPIKLFDSANDHPALLSAGQHVSFRAIDRDEFEHLAHPANR